MTDFPRRPFGPASEARRELDRLIEGNLGFRLGPYLKKIAQASAFAAMVAGCSMTHAGTDAGPPVGDAGDTDAGMIDAGEPPPPPSAELCSPDGRWLAVQGLNPSRDVDWVGALNYSDFVGPSGDFIDEAGERCVGATDAMACEAEVETARFEIFQRALLTTAEDLERLETAEQINTFLGTVDTQNEAALAAWKAGYDIWCSDEDPSSVTSIPGGWRVIAYRQSGGCGSPWITSRHTLRVSGDGTVTEESSEVIREEEDFGCIGRRPEGLRADAPSRGQHPVGAFFANVTRLEASAVDAFDIMREELETLGAPESLREAALAAREDEVRHTVSMAAIARRYGAEPGTHRVDPMRARSPYEIALENAVEGCVRETFGALVGAYQASAARDPQIRDAMREVSDDELRHAELSWALASWLEPKLTAEERARVATAKREAIDALREEARREHDPALLELAGLPGPDTAVAMVDRLAEDLWA